MKNLGMLLLSSAFGLLSILPFSASQPDASFGSMVVWMGFGNVGLGSAYLIDFLYAIVPMVVFQMVYGLYLYRHFCTASVYYFSRCIKRKSWFLQETGSLLLKSFLYESAYWIAGLFVLAFKYPFSITMADVCLFLYAVTINVLWLFASTLAVNILALKTDSVAGFGIIFGLEVFFIVIYNFMESLFLYGKPEGNAGKLLFILWKWNPVSQLVVRWHSSMWKEIDAMVNDYQVNFDFNFSVLYLAILSAILIILGISVISRVELISNGMEE